MDIITDNAIITYPAILSAVVEVIKRMDIIDSRFMPFVSVLLGLVGAWYLKLDLLTGLVIGLTAVGLYQGVKTTVRELI